MRPSRFTEERIIGMLKEQEAGAKTADVCRKHGVSAATFYKFKANHHRPHSAIGNMPPAKFALKSMLEKQAA